MKSYIFTMILCATAFTACSDPDFDACDKQRNGALASWPISARPLPNDDLPVIQQKQRDRHFNITACMAIRRQERKNHQ